MKSSKLTLVLAIACLSATSGQLGAQEVRFMGTTTGCFFYTGTCTPTSSATLYDLTFYEGAFDGTTSNGQLVVGGVDNNLGTFWLGGDPTNYNVGWNFLLNVAFQLPTLTDPNAVYNALIGGIVVNDELGMVHIVFDETPQVFTFDGPDNQRGYFSLVVPEFGIMVGGAGDETPIVGNIEATVTPEPATMALLATGLAGLLPAARRRRRKSAA